MDKSQEVLDAVAQLLNAEVKTCMIVTTAGVHFIGPVAELGPLLKLHGFVQTATFGNPVVAVTFKPFEGF
jgi:hypothetical protein